MSTNFPVHSDELYFVPLTLKEPLPTALPDSCDGDKGDDKDDDAEDTGSEDKDGAGSDDKDDTGSDDKDDDAESDDKDSAGWKAAMPWLGLASALALGVAI